MLLPLGFALQNAKSCNTLQKSANLVNLAKILFCGKLRNSPKFMILVEIMKIMKIDTNTSIFALVFKAFCARAENQLFYVKIWDFQKNTENSQK